MHLSWSLVMVAASILLSSMASAKPTVSTFTVIRRNTKSAVTRPLALGHQASKLASNSSKIADIDPAANATNTACIGRLLNLNGIAGSPTGMSVCYTITQLDNSTGEFESEVNLYQVSPATGNWTTIDPNSLNVNIAYTGANLTKTALSRRSLFSSVQTPSSKRSTPPHMNSFTRRATNPVHVFTESFDGQVTTGWDQKDIAKQMMLLQPIVTISALTPQMGSEPQKPLSNALPPNEAAFVTGVFAAQASTAAAAALASASAKPFVLPGTRAAPAILPIGPIITGVWVLFFVITVGGGTLGRLQFRNAYRRKSRFQEWTAGTGAPKKATAMYEQRTL